MASRRNIRPRKKRTPEESVVKLRRVDFLVSQGPPVTGSIRKIGVNKVTHCRWGQDCGGWKLGQVMHLKELQLKNVRLRKAVSDFTRDKVILKSAAQGKY